MENNDKKVTTNNHLFKKTPKTTQTYLKNFKNSVL